MSHNTRRCDIQYISPEDALKALGDEPAVWDEEDLVEIQTWRDWDDHNQAISTVTPLPFELRPLCPEELFNAKGKSVILSAPDQPGLDKRAVTCNGLKTRGTHQWLDLNGQRYDLGLFLNRHVTAWEIV